MTLDEAIKHEEEVMTENLEKTKDRNASDPIAINCFECAKEHRQLAGWLKELKQLREQTRWIPVGERLPEKGRQVLCCNKYGSVFTSAVTYIKEDEYGHKLAYFGEHYEVVAWMPLPRTIQGRK